VLSRKSSVLLERSGLESTSDAMKYVSIFHANLNYAFLEPHKYEQVIRASYETIIDGHAKVGPEAKYVFEASGYTIDVMADKCPDVLAKLRRAIESGQCEFMGAPYAHPVMANIPEEDGYWTNEFSQRAYEKHLGFRAESFWNPECTWMQWVPRAFRKAGAKYLTLDFESYMNSNDKEYAWVEKNRATDIYWGGHMPWFDLDPNCKFLHRPFRDITPGLHGFCRSDRLVGKYISYFLGKISLEDYLANVKHWSGTGDGATIVIADDAEYCGTTGYFYVKYYRDYSRSFSIRPDAAEKLDALIKGLLALGPLATFKEACETVPPVEEPFFVEDRYAWHRTYSDCWGGTPEAKALDPELAELRKEYKKYCQPIAEGTHRDRFLPLAEKFWFHMTNSANSDGRWPPPPAQTCEFNRQWVRDEINATKAALTELRSALAGIPLPAEPDLSNVPADTPEYGYYFTDKPLDDLTKLTFYELQHALYAAWRGFDQTTGSDKASFRERVLAIYDEYRRRGITQFTTPKL
jgi:hypothetical protein